MSDPFEALDREVKRQEGEEKAAAALAKSVTRLVLDSNKATMARSAFFASLVMRLGRTPDWSVDTMAVDGKTLYYNPDFVNRLTPNQQVGVLAHETLHVGLAHHARQGARDASKWNVACDHSINSILEDAGFELPPCRLMPGEGKYKNLSKGLSAEEYYSKLPDEPQGGSGGDGGQKPGQGQGNSPDAGGADPGGCGGVRPPQGGPAAAAESEHEWKEAVLQAEVAAKNRGTLPAGIARLVQEATNPPEDWRAILRDFVSSHARNDFSWSRPNRRFIAQGLYLPGMFSEELGDIVIAIDTSGSVGGKELAAFENEINGILGAFDCTATIIYCDATIQDVQEWRTSDGPLKLTPKGGGGTSHVPVFDWLDRSGADPACVVCLTDLYTDYPSRVPDYPVLWAVSGGKKDAPFGRVIQVTA